MNFELFYEELRRLFPQHRLYIDAFYSNVLATISDVDDVRDYKKICSLFRAKKHSIGRTTFFRTRGFVTALYKWLNEQGYVGEEMVRHVSGLRYEDIVSDMNLYRSYFANLDEVLDFIDMVNNRNCGGATCIMPVKCVAVLAWCGVSRSEMVHIKKNDLDIRNSQVMVGERVIRVERRHMDVLRELACTETFTTRTHRFATYVSSPYLLRSSKVSSMSVNSVSMLLKQFNEDAETYGKIILTNDLTKNGLLLKMYRWESEGKPYPTLAVDQFLPKPFYERWKQLLIGDDAI